MRKIDVISTIIRRSLTGEKITSGNTIIIEGGSLNVNELVEELSKKFISADDFKKYWEEREDPLGNRYLYSTFNVATQGGVTMYANGGDINIPSIYDGLPIDGTTIYWEYVDGSMVLKAKGGGGSISEITKQMVIDALGFTPISSSDIPKTLPNPYVLKFGTKEYDGNVSKTILASDLGALTSHQTIYTLTFQSGTFASGSFTANSGNKTINIPTTTSHVSEGSNLYFTNARAVSALAETLKSYVTLSGTQTISGEKNFTGGLKVNGSPIVYDAAKKYWKLEGDLLITGGLTMYGSDSSFTPSTIMDAIAVDGTTISKDGGVLRVIGGGSGSISEITKQMVIDALGFTPISSSDVPTALPNPHSLKFGSKLYDGSASKTILASDLGALTAHQTIHSLTVKDSAGTTKLTYTPNIGTGSLTLTKEMVGLGNVDNLAASGYLTALSSDTTNAVSITVGGTTKSITSATMKASLGLGSLAYKSSLTASDIPNLDWSKITSGKPTTLSGYGITDAKIDNGVITLGSSSITPLTGITSALVTGALGYTPYNAANFTKASIKSTLGISDWALEASKPSYEWDDILGRPTLLSSFTDDVVAGKYLPLSGGIISEGLTIGGTLYATNNMYLNGWFSLKNHYFFVRDNADADWIVTNENWTKEYSLIHSGNYSSYALPLSGGTMSSNAYIAWNTGTEGNDVNDWNTIDGNGLRIISSISSTSNAPIVYSTALHVKGRYGFQLASRGGANDNFYIRNIGTSDARDWMELIHSGNYSSYALPLSGGTLTSHLTLSQNSRIKMNGGLIEFNGSDGSFEAFLGRIAGTNNLGIYDGSVWRNIIHSGNIGSQSVSYATSAKCLTSQQATTDDFGSYLSTYGAHGLSVIVNTSGAAVGNIGAMDSVLNIGSVTNRLGRFLFQRHEYSEALYWQSANGTGTGWGAKRTIAFTDSNVASATRARYIETQMPNSDDWYVDRYRAYTRWGSDNANILDWRTEGDYPVRVDIAKKLNTARTIWGQSFDGTGDVDGSIYPNASSSFHCGSNTNQWYSVYTMYLLAKSGSNLNIGANNSTNMLINSSGNVTIGGSDLAGTSAKLHVDGNILTTGGVTMYSQRNLKNITDERGLSLDELRTIKPTRYTWKDGRDDRIHFGGIADDIQQVLPEVVYNANGVLTMDYGNAAFAIASSLIQPVIRHENEITSLKRKVRELEEEVKRLKSA